MYTVATAGAAGSGVQTREFSAIGEDSTRSRRQQLLQDPSLANSADVTSSKQSSSCAHRLAGKRILLVCCGHAGLDSKRFLFERALELGVRPFLLEDERNILATELDRDGLLEAWLKVSMVPRATLLDECMWAIEETQSRVGLFDGICTFWDDAVTLAARLCRRAGLPGMDIAAVDIAHDKYLTRKTLREAQIPCPKFALIRQPADLIEAQQHIGFPAIMKPMYGASSLGVQKVECAQDLMDTYHRILESLETYYREGELMGLTFDNGSDNNNEGTNQCELAQQPSESAASTNSILVKSTPLSYLVMEEFLQGGEVDVDLVLDNGRLIYDCVVDDWPQIEPWFSEQGSNCPSVLDEVTKQTLTMMALRGVRAMGFESGIMHVELKNAPIGPRIIEVNPRMGGGPLRLMHKLAYGMDFVEQQFMLACHIPLTYKRPYTPLTCLSCGECFFDSSFTVGEEFVEQVVRVQSWDKVVLASSLVRAGELAVGLNNGFPTRCTRFIVSGDTPIDAQNRAIEIVRQMVPFPSLRDASKQPSRAVLGFPMNPPDGGSSCFSSTDFGQPALEDSTASTVSSPSRATHSLEEA